MNRAGILGGSNRGVLVEERRSSIDQLVVEVIHESNPPLAIGADICRCYL
jgi:hypothetical protein